MKYLQTILLLLILSGAQPSRSQKPDPWKAVRLIHSGLVNSQGHQSLVRGVAIKVRFLLLRGDSLVYFYKEEKLFGFIRFGKRISGKDVQGYSFLTYEVTDHRNRKYTCVLRYTKEGRLTGIGLVDTNSVYLLDLYDPVEYSL